jgi:UDP-glucose 4-epimerase
MEVISAFEKACKHKIPYKILDRRPGDAAISYADPSKANHELDWYAYKTLEEMCLDAWRWQVQNPDGYS